MSGWGVVRRRRPALVAALGWAFVLLGCGSTSVVASVTTSLNPTPSPTVSTTATVAPAATIVSQSYACPVTVTGTTKTFADAASGFSFNYPAAWTEQDCVRFGGADSAEFSILIGNLFFVHIVPRNGMTAQQFVATQNSATQTFTLTPTTVAQAQEADTVTGTFAPNMPAPPTGVLAQAKYLIVGSNNFYVISPLIAQMSMTDTLPNTSDAIPNVVASFAVA